MRAAGCAILVAVALLSPVGAGSDEGAPAAEAAITRTLEARGFAVDAGSSARLFSTYRHPGRDAVFVSADAGISLCILLLRRGVDERALVGDADLARDVASWDAAVRARATGEAGLPARFFTAVLANLACSPPSAPDPDVSSAVEAQVARVRGEGPLEDRAGLLGTPLDEAFLRALVRNAATPEQGRRDAAVFWITRARLPGSPAGDTARKTLVDTLPQTLKDFVIREFERAGACRLRFPGAEGVFDVEVPGDRRFPPGTLPGHAEAVGLETGARLGSGLARDLLSGDPFGKRIAAGDASAKPSWMVGFPTAAANFAPSSDFCARTSRAARGCRTPTPAARSLSRK